MREAWGSFRTFGRGSTSRGAEDAGARGGRVTSGFRSCGGRNFRPRSGTGGRWGPGEELWAGFGRSPAGLLPRDRRDRRHAQGQDRGGWPLQAKRRQEVGPGSVRSLRGDVTSTDIILMGALLAQPLSSAPDWMRSRAARPRSTSRACDRPTGRRSPGVPSPAPSSSSPSRSHRGIDRAEPAVDERAQRIERLDAFVEHAREALKDMRHIGPDVERAPRSISRATFLFIVSPPSSLRYPRRGQTRVSPGKEPASSQSPPARSSFESRTVGGRLHAPTREETEARRGGVRSSLCGYAVAGRLLQVRADCVRLRPARRQGQGALSITARISSREDARIVFVRMFP
jgi:hypothetical protein